MSSLITLTKGVDKLDKLSLGIGPVPSIRKLCDLNGIFLNDVDLIEVNEAFAAQFLAVQKELGLDLNKTNVNGGAIAIGHRMFCFLFLIFISFIAFICVIN